METLTVHNVDQEIATLRARRPEVAAALEAARVKAEDADRQRITLAYQRHAANDTDIEPMLAQAVADWDLAQRHVRDAELALTKLDATIRELEGARVKAQRAERRDRAAAALAGMLTRSKKLDSLLASAGEELRMLRQDADAFWNLMRKLGITMSDPKDAFANAIRAHLSPGLDRPGSPSVLGLADTRLATFAAIGDGYGRLLLEADEHGKADAA